MTFYLIDIQFQFQFQNMYFFKVHKIQFRNINCHSVFASKMLIIFQWNLVYDFGVNVGSALKLVMFLFRLTFTIKRGQFWLL